MTVANPEIAHDEPDGVGSLLPPVFVQELGQRGHFSLRASQTQPGRASSRAIRSGERLSDFR